MVREPAECASLQEVRAEIDRIDQGIIAALGERARYVRAAARFKRSDAEVHAPDRVQSMLAQRRAWAAEERLDPDVIEALYRDLVAYFTREEFAHRSRGSS